MTQKKERPLVSICAVCYNHANYLRQALDGFLAQRGDFDIEILVHDDASTDGSAEILRRYAARYPDKIFPILQRENQYRQGRQNISGIFNFPRARGKYIALMDCDDYWCNPGKLEAQVSYLEAHPDCAMTVHAAAVKNDRGELVNRNLMRPYRGDRDLSPAELNDKTGSFPFGAMLLRREVVEQLPDWYFRCPVGDRPLELLAALKGYCHYADRFDSVYRFHGAGSWTEEMKSGDLKKKQDAYAIAMRELYRAFDRESGETLPERREVPPRSSLGCAARLLFDAGESPGLRRDFLAALPALLPGTLSQGPRLYPRGADAALLICGAPPFERPDIPARGIKSVLSPARGVVPARNSPAERRNSGRSRTPRRRYGSERRAVPCRSGQRDGRQSVSGRRRTVRARGDLRRFRS